MREPWWISLIKAGVIVNLIMVAFAYTTWLERKLLGRLQNSAKDRNWDSIEALWRIGKRALKTELLVGQSDLRANVSTSFPTSRCVTTAFLCV